MTSQAIHWLKRNDWADLRGEPTRDGENGNTRAVDRRRHFVGITEDEEDEPRRQRLHRVAGAAGPPDPPGPKGKLQSLAGAAKKSLCQEGPTSGHF